MVEKNEIKMNLLEPRATEKSYLEQTNRIYVFPIDKNASKQQIAEMVEKEFSVKVTDVRTMIRKGKKTRYNRGKHAYPGITYRQDKKFAYVRLAKGDSIRVFEDMNEVADEKNNKTSAKDSAKDAKKADKKADDKNAGKEKK